MKKNPYFFAGPCVMESFDLTIDLAKNLQTLTNEFGYDLYFKMMFDKANRSSLNAYRGPGLDEGIKWIKAIKEQLNIRVFTDVHETYQCDIVASVVDVIQIPAFLCKQTDLVVNAAKTGKKINVKKGQFVAPQEMNNILAKIRQYSNADIFFTERGSFFGYGDTIVDMRSLEIMREMDVQVLFDGTHSVLRPGKYGNKSGGENKYSSSLLRAAAGVGVDGFFLEVHPNPEKALCDGHSMTSLNELKEILKILKKINEIVILHV